MGSNLSTMLLEGVTLLSIRGVIILSIYNKFAPKKILNRHSDLFPRYLTIMSITIGVISDIISLIHLFSTSWSSIGLPDYAYDIFVLFSSGSHFLQNK